jgi:hypothetical protein
MRAISVRRMGGLAAALLVLLPTLGAAQEEREEEVERLEAWPELEDEAQAEIDVQRLRQARTEEMGEQAREGLIAAGAGVAPLLLPALAKEKDEDALERIEAVLEAVTGAPHTRLLAAEFGDRSQRVRTWCLLRVARFPDPGVRAAAEDAFTKAAARAKKKPKDEEAARERYAAALCCASAGSLAGLDAVAERAEEAWGKAGAEIRAALEAVRGPEATRAVAPLLEEKGRTRRLAGLHLLAGCGDRETAVPLVLPFLDTTDNSLRIAAINALRGIVDGEPPIERLAVFDAIEMAKTWKDRL